MNYKLFLVRTQMTANRRVKNPWEGGLFPDLSLPQGNFPLLLIGMLLRFVVD